MTCAQGKKGAKKYSLVSLFGRKAPESQARRSEQVSRGKFIGLCCFPEKRGLASVTTETRCVSREGFSMASSVFAGVRLWRETVEAVRARNFRNSIWREMVWKRDLGSQPEHEPTWRCPCACPWMIDYVVTAVVIIIHSCGTNETPDAATVRVPFAGTPWEPFWNLENAERIHHERTCAATGDGLERYIRGQKTVWCWCDVN